VVKCRNSLKETGRTVYDYGAATVQGQSGCDIRPIAGGTSTARMDMPPES
jgi:hypothetical protein